MQGTAVKSEAGLWSLDTSLGSSREC